MYYMEDEILLVNPTGGWEQKKDDRYFFPIGLLYLENYLLKNGIPSKIIDVKPHGLSPEDFKKMVRTYKPKIIGFTGSPFERHILHQYINGIKDYAPDALVVGGGPYFTATAKECLIHLTDVDVVVRGEGEVTLLELVQAFAQDNSFEDIAGITYRDELGNIVENRNRRPSDRDHCEIDIKLLRDDSIYSPFVYLKNFEKEKILALPILLARGCIKKCTYCFNNSSGRFRSRSIGSIIEEIQLKRRQFESDYFWMVDPTFTLREEFAYELCQGLRKHCPGIKWYCETRADCSLDLLGEMAKAGCISVDFALESGSPKVLKAIRKDIDVSCVVDFAKESKKLGMRALVFVMYSLPEETYGDFLMTMRVLAKIKRYIYDVEINPTYILPGTQLEEQARGMNLLPENFSWYDPSFGEIPKWESLMSEKEIARCRKTLAYYRYSLHHSKIACLRKRLGDSLEASVGENAIVVWIVREFPTVGRFLRFSRELVFGSD